MNCKLFEDIDLVFIPRCRGWCHTQHVDAVQLYHTAILKSWTSTVSHKLILGLKPTWWNELCYSSVLNPWEQWIYPAGGEWTFSFRMKSGQGHYCVRVSGQQKSHSLFMSLTDSYLERETRPEAQYYWSWSLWCLILATEKCFYSYYFSSVISNTLRAFDVQSQGDLIPFHSYSYLYM